MALPTWLKRTSRIAASLVPLALIVVGVEAPVLAASPSEAAPSPGSLEQQFQSPPTSARPRVWWHWLNGNITKDGLAKDLRWMKRVGIGGAQAFDANIKTPQIVDKRLVYMTPEWKEAFRFAAEEADRLGLELAIASSPGWSETGGPWVPPADGLKKLVWSEREIVGGRRVSVSLAMPPSATGPFQSLRREAGHGAVLRDGAEPPVPAPFYRDVAVLAVPADRAESSAKAAYADANGQAIDGSALIDDDLQSGVELVRPQNGPIVLLSSYAVPQTVRSATLFVQPASRPLGGGYVPQLEASDTGKTWRLITTVALGGVPTTVSFAPVTARHFRLRFDRAKPAPLDFAPPPPGVDVSTIFASGARSGGTNQLRVLEFRLSALDRVDRVETKAGFAISTDYFALSKDVPDATGAAVSKVIDLTERMRADGKIDWVAPKGRWRLVRLGYSLLGTTNQPASVEATGLEVDKFDGAAVRRYLDHYLGMYKDAAGSQMIGEHGVRAILTDSIEVGAANWTPRLIEQFRRLRGYDPVPWLPTLTGMLIGSRTASDRFLYDFRRTLADLMASEHYGVIASFAHANGLKVYGEALEDRRPSLGDDMAMRSHADYPMAALWTYARDGLPKPTYLADMKGAASVAHVYGQNIAAAESMTSLLSPWAFGPADLKRFIDLEFVTGINRPIIHTSVHVPVDNKVPGLSLSIFGQYFNRHEAWAELARPWVDYIARNSLLLQQGKNVADIAYFYGEEAPLTGLFGATPVADAPVSVAYDFIDAGALVGLLSNNGADLVTPGGARYRALYLGGSSRQMTLPTLRKIVSLVEAGGTIIGHRPVSNPGLVGDAAEFDALADRLWPSSGSPYHGAGRVIVAPDSESALAHAGIPPDFSFVAENGGDIGFVHRRLEDGDGYFLSNRLSRAQTGEAHFRVTGKAPELWHAETGTTETVSYRTEDGQTIVPIALAADESVHVLFRKNATSPSLDVVPTTPTTVGRISGPWHVTFQEGRGAPADATFNALKPLNEHNDPGIKYFSGIATYRTTLSTPKGWRSKRPLWLDLATAHEVAEVAINGKLAGFAWHAPYRVEIGQQVKPGHNQLVIRVANLWVNRLIGDRQPAAQKVTWTTGPTYTAKAPLRSSGLIGPVTLMMKR